MARPKEFDPDYALEQAMQTFWTRGYQATTTQHLVDALGINRSSLYGTFGSKHELYLRALERYTRRHGDGSPEWVAPLVVGTGPLRSRLREALLRAVEDLRRAEARGCLACNAAIELAAVDDRVRRLTTHAFVEVRGVFRETLIRARDEGEIASDADVDGLASLLVATLEGMHVLAKGTGDRRLIEQAVDAAVAAV